jgi:hypothetical protein
VLAFAVGLTGATGFTAGGGGASGAAGVANMRVNSLGPEGAWGGGALRENAPVAKPPEGSGACGGGGARFSGGGDAVPNMRVNSPSSGEEAGRVVGGIGLWLMGGGWRDSGPVCIMRVNSLGGWLAGAAGVAGRKDCPASGDCSMRVNSPGPVGCTGGGGAGAKGETGAGGADAAGA